MERAGFKQPFRRLANTRCKKHKIACISAGGGHDSTSPRVVWALRHSPTRLSRALSQYSPPRLLSKRAIKPENRAIPMTAKEQQVSCAITVSPCTTMYGSTHAVYTRQSAASHNCSASCKKCGQLYQSATWMWGLSEKWGMLKPGGIPQTRPYKF